MDKHSAFFLSVVFHPLLMPFYGVLLLFYTVDVWFVYTLAPNAKLLILAVVGMNTVFVPMLFFIYLVKTGKISDYRASKKNERYLPLLITLIFYVSTYILLHRLGLNRVLLSFILIATVSLTAAFFINFIWKVSMHMIGLGGVFGFFYVVARDFNVEYTLYLVLIIISMGLVGSARMKLKEHSLAQVMAGAGLGISVAVLLMTFFG